MPKGGSIWLGGAAELLAEKAELGGPCWRRRARADADDCDLLEAHSALGTCTECGVRSAKCDTLRVLRRQQEGNSARKLGRWSSAAISRLLRDGRREARGGCRSARPCPKRPPELQADCAQVQRPQPLNCRVGEKLRDETMEGRGRAVCNARWRVSAAQFSTVSAAAQRSVIAHVHCVHFALCTQLPSAASNTGSVSLSIFEVPPASAAQDASEKLITCDSDGAGHRSPTWRCAPNSSQPRRQSQRARVSVSPPAHHPLFCTGSASPAGAAGPRPRGRRRMAGMAKWGRLPGMAGRG